MARAKYAVVADHRLEWRPTGPDAAEHEGHRRFETGDPEGRLVELDVLPHRRVRSVVGRDGVDGPVNDRGPERANVPADRSGGFTFVDAS